MADPVAVQLPPPAAHPGGVRAAFVRAEYLESLGKYNAVGGVFETFRCAVKDAVVWIAGTLEGFDIQQIAENLVFRLPAALAERPEF